MQMVTMKTTENTNRKDTRKARPEEKSYYSNTKLIIKIVK